MKRWKSSLVLVEHANNKLVASTLNAISAAAKLGDVSCLVAGHECAAVSFFIINSETDS